MRGQRPLQIFGSGEQTRTLTHVDDIADGIVTAMASPAGENEDFNISASEELTVAEIARLIWEACGNDPAELELEHLPSFEVDVAASLAVGARRRASCSAGRRRSTCAMGSRRRCSGCASSASAAQPPRSPRRDACGAR